MTVPPELHDRHVYGYVSFNVDTFEFCRAAVAYYESLLQRDLETVKGDEDLRTILDDRVLDSYPITRELKRVERVLGWCDKVITEGGTDPWDYDVSISHGRVRFLKSAANLYLNHLRNRRQLLAERSYVSKAMLETVDQQLARFEEQIGLGVFYRASPYPLQVDQVQTTIAQVDMVTPSESGEVSTPRPRPVILDTIEIRDPILRKRCLDLLAQFREDGQSDRLDTVVNEATRILEDRLRSLSVAR